MYFYGYKQHHPHAFVNKLKIIMKSRQILAYQKYTILMNNVLIAVRNGDFTLPYLSSYEIECLVTT